ncbi:hypothetical protein [Parasitella parasitica]|uniref:RING-type E3 ubiquitin transferase n=1 Tax=Parasitella parasitica TaxID=35722 RepID=A0A0B7N1X5_9FUNG|nr:hypothetical protein [Parasitella parasitica]
MCMKTARLTDLRNVIPSRLTAKDTASSDKLKAELERKKIQIKEDERSLDNSRLALAVLVNQIKSQEAQLKYRRVMKERAEKLINTPYSQSQHIDTQDNKPKDKPKLKRYAIFFSHQLSENRNVSRVMDFDTLNNLSYVSFKSMESEYGILKLNPQDPNNTKFVPVHTSPIKDIKYGDFGLIMTASLDKSLKFTTVTSNTVADSISLPAPGWSCCYDPNDEYKAICGLADSSVMVYDRRNTKSFLQKYQSPLILPTPMHSLFIRDVNRESTIYCSNLKQTFVWNARSNCKLWDLNQDSGKDKTSTIHQIIDVGSNAEVPTVLTTMKSVVPQNGLTRTYSYTPQDSTNSPIICYSDQVLGSLNLARNNDVLQHFNIRSCPLDIRLFDDKQLAFLTDNRFFLLKPLYDSEQ